MTTPESPILEVEGLSTEIAGGNEGRRVVEGVSLRVERGETVGVVGESGCGKTMLALSILRLLPPGVRITSGRIVLRGIDIVALDEPGMRRLRGRRLAMSFQDPMTALNPVMRVRAQVREAMQAHEAFSAHASARVAPLLERVGIPDARRRADDYPHQFSGGMRQRVMVAMGIANEPDLLVADEATTALDVTAQSLMVGLLGRLNKDLGTAVMLITHNMALVAGLARRVVVMYAGRIIEEGTVDQVFAAPEHPYTSHLLAAIPRIDKWRPGGQLATIEGVPPEPGRLPPGCTFHPRCPFREPRCSLEEPPLIEVRPGQRARCWVLMRNVDTIHHGRGGAPSAEATRSGSRTPAAGDGRRGAPDVILEVRDVCKQFTTARGELVTAVDRVSLAVIRGQTTALIGRSGCGKSTLARIVTALLPSTSGSVVFEGHDVTALTQRRMRPLRQRLQIVFQDPFASLDPRLRVVQIIAEPLRNFGMRRDAAHTEAHEVLDAVGLHAALADRYPHELSGGQRQRVGLARALVLRPSLLICDEPVSALDVSVQAQIINLLRELHDRFSLTYLFISHDLGVVRYVADRVAVMHGGRIVETAAVDELYEHPHHPHTRALLDAIPVADPVLARARLERSSSSQIKE